MFSSVSNRAAARVLASSVLPTPVGPRKMNDPIGRRGSLIPERARIDGVGDQPDGLVLADHPLVEDLVQAQQLVALALLQPAHRDPGPGRDDLGDLLLGDHLAQQPPALLGGQLLLLGRQPPFQLGQLAVAQLGGPVQVVGPLGLLGLVADLLQLLAQLLDPADGPAFGLPLGPHGVGLAAEVGQLPPQLLQPDRLAGSVSLARAASSISSRASPGGSARPARPASSRSRCGAGREASSTRSMALSGRNRSLM